MIIFWIYLMIIYSMLENDYIIDDIQLYQWKNVC